MNNIEGTRQNNSVTSGEGGSIVNYRCNIIVGSDCLLKTQDSAKLIRWCIGSDTCPVL